MPYKNFLGVGKIFKKMPKSARITGCILQILKSSRIRSIFKICGRYRVAGRSMPPTGLPTADQT